MGGFIFRSKSFKNKNWGDIKIKTGKIVVLNYFLSYLKILFSFKKKQDH